MTAAGNTPAIYVLAGVNGAGKSSVGGAMIRAQGADYFNPDEAASSIALANPGISPDVANVAAWQEGKRLLEEAVANRRCYAFETTLGGETITALLEKAADAGFDVWVWYVGLDTPERCIARVRARVAAGGHPIPEAKIRERFVKSPLNLIRLLPKLAKLLLFDNTTEGNPCAGKRPRPKLLLDMEYGNIIRTCNLRRVPDWAKPILAVALRLSPQPPA